MKKSAAISNCNSFRYELERDWSDGSPLKTLGIIGLNPSTADAEIDDNTIRKDISFAKIHGFNRILKGNLFGIRSTDPEILNSKILNSYQTIGPDNWTYIEKILKQSEIVILAWGAHPAAFMNGQHFIEEFFYEYGHKFYHLGPLTKMGAPRHTLYLPYSSSLNKVKELYGLLLKEKKL